MLAQRDNRFNNFDLIRTLFSLMVVFAHLYALTNIKEIAWFWTVFNGDFAVKGFFTISGYLIMGSYISSQDAADFFKKRFIRIYPAYFAIIVFCLLIGLLCSTNRSELLSSPITLKYILANLSFLNTLQLTLPGVFESNPIHAINGALWTVKEEIFLYLSIPLMYYLFQRFNQYALVIALISFSLLWLYFFKFVYTGSHGIEISRQAPGELAYFAIGAFLFINNRVFKQLFIYVLIFALAYFLCPRESIKELIQPFFYSSLTIFLCTQAVKNLRFGRFGDLSFGIYLYHFPIIQLLLWANIFNENLYLAIALTLVSTICCALISWNFIEKRFLRKSSHYIKAYEKKEDLLPLDGRRGLS